MKSRDAIVDAMRELVADIYNDCKGAYGSECGYSGQYERQIQKLVDALVGERP